MKIQFDIHPKYYSPNACRIYSILLCVTLLLLSAYFQYVSHMQPCPLCIVQRYMLVFLVVSFMLPFTTDSRNWQRGFGCLSFMIALIGAFAAGRQVYLESLPASEVTQCGPSFDYMMKTLPISETIHLLFQGSGDCAAVHWSLLGLSMAMWSLLCFIAFLVLILWNLYRI